MNKKPGYALISSILIIAVVVFVMSGASASGYITGKVIDNSTLQPIKGAIVTINDYIVETDEKGFFKINTAAQKVSVRAHGYSRTEQLITAPQNGFDEIQFDYVRFPDAKGPAFSVENTEENRVNAISGFLTEVK